MVEGWGPDGGWRGRTGSAQLYLNVGGGDGVIGSSWQCLAGPTLGRARPPAAAAAAEVFFDDTFEGDPGPDPPPPQGLTLVHFSAEPEHILWNTLGA